jgi:hypothetical protein
LTFDLAALYQGDHVQPNEEYRGQAFFPHQLAKRHLWIPPGKYFIEPGLKAKYSYVAEVPLEATFLMLHAGFTYENQRASHRAGCTVAVPSAASGASAPRLAEHDGGG